MCVKINTISSKGILETGVKVDEDHKHEITNAMHIMHNLLGKK